MFYLNRLFTLQEQLGPELVDEHNFFNLSVLWYPVCFCNGKSNWVAVDVARPSF